MFLFHIHSVIDGNQTITSWDIEDDVKVYVIRYMSQALLECRKSNALFFEKLAIRVERLHAFQSWKL